MSKTTITNETQKLISFRIPVNMLDLFKSKAKSQDRTLSNYIRRVLVQDILQDMDETEYLMSSAANKARLLDSVGAVKVYKTFTTSEFEALSK